MSKKSAYNLTFSIFIIALSLWIYVYQYSLFEGFDKRIVDTLFKIRGEKRASSDIVIVDIDEKSLKVLGQWPWQRYKVAKILNNLAKAKAGIIGLDVVFAEPDNSSPSKVFKRYHIKMKDAEDYDEILAKTIATTPTIAGYAFSFDKSADTTTIPQIPAIFIEKNLPKESDFLIKAVSIIPNIPIIQQNAYSSGFFNTFPDSDGIVRSVPLVIKYKNQIFPSLSLEMVRAMLGTNKVFVNYSNNGVESIKIGSLAIPTDRHGRLFVNYRGPSKSYRYISALDIYGNTFDKSLIEGKIILIGTSALGLLDLRATPFESTFAGVEVHANAIDNIINQDFIYRPDWAEGADILIILSLGIILALTFSFAPPLVLGVLSATILLSFFGFNYYMLFYKGVILNIAIPLFSMLMLFVTSMITNYFFETKQKELIKDKFAKKVSPAVVEDLLKHGTDTLETKEKEISIFFSDIRGFTTISEKIGSPKKLIDLLNRYMTPMVDVIISHHGTIDKFIGDAIMAYWNAPNDLVNHQDSAVTSAVEQIEKLKELDKVLKSEGLPTINIGIGIHTGVAIVGEMGSYGRSDYTVIGDNVNLASRLEGLNKFYASRIIISEYTYNALKNKYQIRELDRVRVKGKEKPVVIYEVLKTGKDDILEKEIDEYHLYLKLYKKQDFNSALEGFKKLNSNKPSRVYEIYIQRCIELIKNPPKEFDGVYEFKTK